MREAGKILAEVHNRLSEIIEPGISTLEIDRKGEEWIREFGCIPSFLNYEGYPESYRFIVVYDNLLLYDGRGKEKSEYSIYRKQHNARRFVGKSET